MTSLEKAAAGKKAEPRKEFVKACIYNNVNIAQITEKDGIWYCATCNMSWTEEEGATEKASEKQPIEVPKEQQGPSPGCICSFENAVIIYRQGKYSCSNCNKSWDESDSSNVWTELLMDSNPSGEDLTTFFEKHGLSITRRNMLEDLKQKSLEEVCKT
jgi:hypothetical protein